MKTVGIVTEYNPLHGGHLHLMRAVRARFGAETAIVCAMSGDFVQRGDFALLRRHARAAAAVQSGVDLVLELPLPWAVSSAERFASGGVEVLLQTGVVDAIAFGSECGDAGAIRRTASALERADFPALLKAELQKGDSFAAARQRAAEQLLSPADAAILREPNNILAVEYAKATLRRGDAVELFTIPRAGARHDQGGAEEDFPSASAIRDLLRRGEREAALALLPDAMRTAYLEEEAAGRAPVFTENCERAILAKLRSMPLSDYLRLDEGGEGLGNRLFDAGHTAPTLAAVSESAKSRRYALSRIRRMILWAYLGLYPDAFPTALPYLRPLAANARGRALLAEMKKRAGVPILTKPADVRKLSEDAQRLFETEARGADLYALGFPACAAEGGALWKQSPIHL